MLLGTTVQCNTQAAGKCSYMTRKAGLVRLNLVNYMCNIWVGLAFTIIVCYVVDSEKEMTNKFQYFVVRPFSK
jgi:hypothetical protein